MRVHRLVLLPVLSTLAVVVAGTTVAARPAAAPQRAVVAQETKSLTPVSPASGWALRLPGPVASDHRFSSVAVGPVLANAATGVAAGFPDGTVRIFTTGGQLARSLKVGSKAVQAGITLVPTRSGAANILAASLDGTVTMFEPNTGHAVFSKKLSEGIFGTPTYADLEGNGRLDVVVTSWDQHIYAWHMDDGSSLPGWPVWVRDSIWSSPTIAHLDGDPRPEVVFGFDCEGGSTQPCYPNYGGYLGVLRGNGQWRTGFPILIPHQTVWSTPAVADLEGNGHADIVVGTGNYTETTKTWKGTQVYAYRSDGKPVPGWPATVGVNTTSSPALGDLDGNGSVEVAIVGTDGRLHVFGRSGVQLWQRCLTGQPEASCNGPYLASPSIADVDDDGRQDIVVGGSTSVTVFDAAGNLTYRAHADGSSDPISNAPTITTVNGKTAIFVEDTASGSSPVGRVYEWTTGTGLGTASWPGFKQGPNRFGVLKDHLWPSSGRVLGTTLTTGQRMYGADSLVDGTYKAVMQGDGNFVVYRGSTPTYATRTSLSGASLVLQGDGNLVLYTMEGVAEWSSRTGGSGAVRLVMQGDGNLVLYSKSAAVWSTRTH